MKNVLSTGMVVAVGLVQCASGSITSLEAGQSVGLSGIDSVSDHSLLGTPEVYFTDFTIEGDSGILFEGSLGYRAVTRLDTGMIDFSWRLLTTEDYEGEVASIEVDGYSAYSVGVAYRTDQFGSIAPTSASRSVDGDTVVFGFDSPPIGNLLGAKPVWVRTDATAYDLSGTARITLVSGEFIELATFAPAVPAPGALAVLGLGGLVAGRRRR